MPGSQIDISTSLNETMPISTINLQKVFLTKAKPMKSWKTTFAGAITAVGVYLESIPEPSYVPVIGKVLIGVGTFLVGLFARDNNISSEQAGAK